MPAARPDPAPPRPCGTVPSARQLRWHALEAYAFVHFSINTFTDMEWGYGDESPASFAPTDFSAEQVVQAIQDAGLKGLILTAKHHDGFCLWPSRFTEHSVKRSPFRNGQGDVVREFADACHRHGLAFGVYLSPWDRNRADYGRPSYVEYFRNQLRELLSNYGPIFEVWFDGANGGDGYFGGARERRKVTEAYYEWETTYRLVRELQPDAVIFSGVGPDVRWVGNEDGIAGTPCWPTISGDAEAINRGDYAALTVGTRLGAFWRPAEACVSIRPGWFYHAREDAEVKTVDQLTEIYFATVGRGAALNLNLPPDRRGRINEADIKVLSRWAELLRQAFASNRAAGATIKASNTRSPATQYSAQQLLTEGSSGYWSTDDHVVAADLVVDLPRTAEFNVVQLREFLPLGCRVDEFAVDAWQNGEWHEFARGTSIGGNRLLRTPLVTTGRVRLRIVKAAAGPALSAFGLYLLSAER
ncbi:MAG TPA: alpha-L-fucosidase [Opitutaceae bacterium]|nr:alpha-L-fucosidase [Opitutaceae bacterium]